MVTGRCQLCTSSCRYQLRKTRSQIDTTSDAILSVGLQKPNKERTTSTSIKLHLSHNVIGLVKDILVPGLQNYSLRGSVVYTKVYIGQTELVLYYAIFFFTPFSHSS
jgi:hypothetical protein